jgi:CRISPR-associated protein Cas2
MMAMVVMVLEAAPPALRGQLSRWLIEVHPGVFVGHVSGMVRDQLWEKCCEKSKDAGVVQMWNSNSEQGFQLRMHGATSRQVVDYEGLLLIRLPAAGDA